MAKTPTMPLSSHSGNVPSTKPDRENMMARKKYEVFKISVQLLKVTNFSIPRGCTSLFFFGRIHDHKHLSRLHPEHVNNRTYTYSKQMIRHNNIKKDGSQALENESEDSKSEEGRSRKRREMNSRMQSHQELPDFVQLRLLDHTETSQP